jgi:hypothetical protein
MKKLTRILSTLSLLAMFNGCASLQGASSGKIGCPEDEVKISNDKMGFNTRSWGEQSAVGSGFFVALHQPEKILRISHAPPNLSKRLLIKVCSPYI